MSGYTRTVTTAAGEVVSSVEISSQLAPAVMDAVATVEVRPAATGLLPDAIMAHGYAVPDRVTEGLLWARSSSSPSVLNKSTDNGATWIGVSGSTFGSERITAIAPLPSGTLLVFTSDVSSGLTASTYIKVWRSTTGGASWDTPVNLTPAGGYVDQFCWDADADWIMAVGYGHRDGTGTAKARYGWRSTDDGATWTQCLDIGAVNSRHPHAVLIDSQGRGWVSTGDDADGDDNARAIWSTDDQGDTWTPHVMRDETGTRLQALPMAEFDGHIYWGEDNIARGRIYRFDPDAPEQTNEMVYEGSGDWAAPFYGMGTDTANGVLYTFQRTEVAANRGRWMASSDGIHWVTLWESGLYGDGPGASRLDFNANYGFYHRWRWAKRTIRNLRGAVAQQVETFVLDWPGTISSKASRWVLPADLLGYSFRLIRLAAVLGTASATDTVSVTAHRGDSTSLARTTADIAANATGDDLAAEALFTPSPALTFQHTLGDRLHIDVTAPGGGDDLTVLVVVERCDTANVPGAY